MKIYLFAGFLALLVGTYFVGRMAGIDEVAAKSAEVVAEAVKEARKSERLKQEKINDVIQKQFNKVNSINSILSDDIDRLRVRSSRRQLSSNSKTNCSGANGSELAKRDAEFLAGYSARAAKQQAALKACYDYADTVGG